MDNPQKSLEYTRQRLAQLVSALTSFNNTLRTPTETFPPWSTLQPHFNVLSSILDSLAQNLSTHFPSANPSTLISYPLPSFPASTQENLLAALSNKKLNLTVQEAVISALNPAPREDGDGDEVGGEGLERALSPEKLNELLLECRDILVEQQEDRNWYDELYTMEEQEAGIGSEQTGLVEGRLEVEKGKAGAGLRLEAMLRFVSTGIMPADQPPLPTGVVGGSQKRS
ncbi:mediator of RNA polymerase II transcription subunit 8 [Rhizina undulata]